MSGPRLANVLKKPRGFAKRFMPTDSFWSLPAFFFIFSVASISGAFLMLNNAFAPDNDITSIWPLLALNILIATGLLLTMGERVSRIRQQNRRGVAGARIQGRMIALFSMVAIMPSILATIFALIALDRGLEHWFSNHTKAVIGNSSSVTDAYLRRQQSALDSEVAMMERDLSSASNLFSSDKAGFAEYFQDQARLRGMQQAMLINGEGDVILSMSSQNKILTLRPSDSSLAAARDNTVIITAVDKGKVLGLRQVSGLENIYLYTVRMLTPAIVEKLIRTVSAVRNYTEMEERRFETQVAFGATYIIVTLVTFLGSVWLGLTLAGRLVLPIGSLIQVSRRLGEGEMDARVDTSGLSGNGEIRELSETFNEMAERLSAQQVALDERRRFTEALLAGVSSGVIGVNTDGVINHVNEAVQTIFQIPTQALIGKKLSEAIPEFDRLMAIMSKNPSSHPTLEFSLENSSMNGRTIRATAQSPASVRGETIITFDDITDMLTAQRNSAWADIAQRIAHEIKNPLTPIQLSAERLQARYGKNGREVDDVFRQCTETIVRQVEDIGSMVDEFASFARMPSARMTHINLADTIFETLLLHRVAHNDIEYVVGDVPEINMIGDRRLIAQSLTNALKNAAEAVRSVKGEKRIELMVTLDEYEVSLSVSDTGKGWPKENRYDLLEPYKTSRDEGTGLGLSIVKKIIDDHRGRLILSDAPWCASGGTGAMLQMVFPLRPHEMVGEAKVSEDL